MNLLNSTAKDDDLLALSGQTQLRVLMLGNTRISDVGLAHLKTLTSLETLDLGTTDITAAGLVHLKGMTKLKRLELYRTTIGDAALAPLSGLTELSVLGLEGTRVGDIGLAHLKNLTMLQALNLSGTNVSDAGLDHLKGLTNLRELHAQGTQVTAAGKKRLQDIWAAARAAGPAVADDGFKVLFNGKDLTGWAVDGNAASWKVESGEIVTNSASAKFGWLFTDKEYSDFRLRLEYQVSPGANTGVALRAVPGEEYALEKHKLQLEVQLADDSAMNQGAKTGGIFWSSDGNSHLAPTTPALLQPSGKWNTLDIEARGPTVLVRVNGAQVQKAHLESLLGRQAVLPGVSRPSGRIGLQSLKGTARFRNIRVERLPPL